MQAKIGELRNRLSYYLKRAAQGETIEVLDRQRPVARIVPIQAGDSERDSWAERLRHSGLARCGPMQPIPEILEGPPPGDGPTGVLQALLDERREGR